MSDAIEIKKVSTADAATLLRLSRRTFFDAFLHRNNAADMEAYAFVAFTLPKIQSELDNTNSEFYFVLIDADIAGYIKLNYSNAQTDLQDPQALEIERIYVIKEYQGRQIGKQLIDFVIKLAVDKQMKYVWLGVWEKNDDAIRFYKRRGFEQFESHPFMLGDDQQTDILMKLIL